MKNITVKSTHQRVQCYSKSRTGEVWLKNVTLAVESMLCAVSVFTVLGRVILIMTISCQRKRSVGLNSCFPKWWDLVFLCIWIPPANFSRLPLWLASVFAECGWWFLGWVNLYIRIIQVNFRSGSKPLAVLLLVDDSNQKGSNAIIKNVQLKITMKAGLIMWTRSNGSCKCSSLKSLPLVILTRLVIILLKSRKWALMLWGLCPARNWRLGRKTSCLTGLCGFPTQRHQTAFSCPSKMSSMCTCRSLGHGCWIARDKTLFSPISVFRSHFLSWMLHSSLTPT